MLPRQATPTDDDESEKQKAPHEEDGRTAGAAVSSFWNPTLRRFMAGVASLGAAETAYLTYSELTGRGSVEIMCGTDGSCASVLTGPYAVLPSTNIPLASLGLVAYVSVAILAVAPLLLWQEDINDRTNRILLSALTFSMATFSAFLMSLLFGVLHEFCPFCVASATFSVILAGCAWLGECLPQENENKWGIWGSLGSVAATTVAALVFFFSVDSSSYDNNNLSLANNDEAQNRATLLASTTSTSTTSTKPSQPLQEKSPPPITTSSSERALELSRNMQSLNARMFGAYWCSHCYDQKQTLGKEAMANLLYVECAKEGKNSQTTLCKDREVPGYPTWEIGGRLFPGERALEELEEIVSEFK